MSSETDFLDLYRTLGLQPGCGLLTLKRAYRRHVSLWHPDHQPPGADDGDLQRLTVQYAAAMAFHRRHGRLPGASASVRAVAIEPMTTSIPRAPRGTSSRSRPTLMALVVVVIVGIAVWNLSPMASSPASSVPADGSGKLLGDGVAPAPLIALGMTAAEVREIEGEPLLVHDDRWEYGPSYVRFERDVVVDWYSSPLRALKVSAERPAHR